MKTDLELISDEVFDMQPTSVRLVETRKDTDGEHRFYEVRAEVYLGGEIYQALVSLCVTDRRGYPATASRTALDIDHANPLTHNPNRE